MAVQAAVGTVEELIELKLAREGGDAGDSSDASGPGDAVGSPDSSDA